MLGFFRIDDIPSHYSTSEYLLLKKKIDLLFEIFKILIIIALRSSALPRICLKDTTRNFGQRAADIVAYIMYSFEDSEQQQDDITKEISRLKFLKTAITFVDRFDSIDYLEKKHVNKIFEVVEFTYYSAQNIFWVARKVCKLLYIVFALIWHVIQRIYSIFHYPC